MKLSLIHMRWSTQGLCREQSGPTGLKDCGHSENGAHLGIELWTLCPAQRLPDSVAGVHPGASISRPAAAEIPSCHRCPGVAVPRKAWEAPGPSQGLCVAPVHPHWTGLATCQLTRANLEKPEWVITNVSASFLPRHESWPS